MLICPRQLICSHCLPNYCSCNIIGNNLIKRRKLRNLVFYSAHSSSTITRFLDILSQKQFTFAVKRQPLGLTHLRRLILSIRDMIPDHYQGRFWQENIPQQLRQQNMKNIFFTFHQPHIFWFLVEQLFLSFSIDSCTQCPYLPFLLGLHMKQMIKATSISLKRKLCEIIEYMRKD